MSSTDFTCFATSSIFKTVKIFRKDTSKIIGMSGERKQNKTKQNKNKQLRKIITTNLMTDFLHVHVFIILQADSKITMLLLTAIS